MIRVKKFVEYCNESENSKNLEFSKQVIQALDDSGVSYTNLTTRKQEANGSVRFFVDDENFARRALESYSIEPSDFSSESRGPYGPEGGNKKVSRSFCQECGYSRF